MEGIAKVAQQQQTQISTQDVNAKVSQKQSTQEVVKEVAKEAKSQGTEINSKEKMDSLVEQLNKAMSPITKNISFAVDKDDIFYVSVKEAETQRLISRFPAEKAMDFLPKMQEVTGILFDTKG